MKAPACLLRFELAPQQGHLQCWAAVAVSLQRFYASQGELPPVPSQEAFARSLLGENCDQVCAPLAALAHAGLLYTESAGPLPPAELRYQLALGHPVPACMRHFIGWHLVVVHGIDADGTLTIADPQVGPSRMPYRSFAQAYRRHYAWTHSYLFAGRATPAHHDAHF